ncbi:MAG: hypothetical protein PWP11_44 [Thauera sp.]|jgi:hypothetical protein|uniref:hypothetical protein n=1 Tax=Thauera propionica TaxID=2019431 RepID=UPI0023F29FF1|nr:MULTISPECIES: hypothetical protein [Thauera]MDD3676543.1 hypothetical protein [Thauera propionica]MDI3488767.1 hypothetical protein [Thauera sp.]
MPFPAFRHLGALALCAALGLGQASFVRAADAQDYSEAERSLFMTNHLANVSPPSTLNYRFHKGGTAEAGFDDKVAIHLDREPNGDCCAGRGEFLSAERRVVLPEIEHAEGNPVILYFLERDVRDMQRLTKGQPNHFRKRIRMAIYNDARVRDAQFDYQGRRVEGREIIISPYISDPSRDRFEQYAGKEYVFLLSDAVPGGVFGIRTLSGPAGSTAEPLILEEMVIDGGTLPAVTANPAAKAS